MSLFNSAGHLISKYIAMSLNIRFLLFLFFCSFIYVFTRPPSIWSLVQHMQLDDFVWEQSCTCVFKLLLIKIEYF